jgi:two-component system, NtrC family, response regulator AtoC
VRTRTSPILEPGAESGFVSGHSPAIQAVNGLVADIAQTYIPVLIVGESGAGKEVYARRLHQLSGLGDLALKKLSCASLDPGRLMEQLRDGMSALDGEVQARTLFLDVVDELDLACQRVLLSLLPDGAPDDGARVVKTRLVCTTSRTLEQEICAGSFRRELYFRINGVCLRLPPLRERKEDIPVLMEYFLLKHALELQRKPPALDAETIDILNAYEWPGNIRELENAAKKMIAMGNTKEALRDLGSAPLKPPYENDRAPISSLKIAARTALRRTERELILQALERTHWNRKRAAQDLQISYKSLLYKIKQIGVQSSETEELKGNV